MVPVYPQPAPVNPWALPFLFLCAAFAAASVAPAPWAPASTPAASAPPGLLNVVEDDGSGRRVERWASGEHAARRERELRRALGPGRVERSTMRDSSAIWRGPAGETVVVVELRYQPAGAPAPSAAGSVRAAMRRELAAPGGA